MASSLSASLDVPRRAGVARRPLGVSLRFLWGERQVDEFFLEPGTSRRFSVGSARGVDFALGDERLEGAAFDLVTQTPEGARLRFTSKMEGEVSRRSGVVDLAQAWTSKLAQVDGDALALDLERDDVARLDLGGVQVEVSLRPAPKAVESVLQERLDFRALNTFLVTGLLAALFIISAENRAAEGFDEDDDGPRSGATRVVKLLRAEPTPVSSASKRPERDARAPKARGAEGAAGKTQAPVQAARLASTGEAREAARRQVAGLFKGGNGLALNVFGAGLGADLSAALGNVEGQKVGTAWGLGGLGLRGTGAGGGSVGELIGQGGLSTRGRGGGDAAYANGSGLIGSRPHEVMPVVPTCDVHVSGALDKELIRQVIHANRGQVRACYERVLPRRPDLAGKVSAHFVISSDGAVSAADIAESTVNDAELETCLANRVRGWVFPKPKGGGVVVVTYPFVFKQSGS